jgi:DNA-directed RNA polymerase subunit beta
VTKKVVGVFVRFRAPLPAYQIFLMFRLNLSRFFQLETKSDERGNEGLYNTFMENFPITDTRNNFVGSLTTSDPPRYTIQECIERVLHIVCL